MNKKILLYILYVLSFIASVAPLCICFFVNFDKYIKTPSDAVRLSIGGVFVLVLLFIKALDKFRVPSGIAACAAAFVCAYLMQSVLGDLTLLLGMLLLGESVDLIFIRGHIRRLKEKIFINKNAEATSKEVEKVIQKYVGRL